MLFSPARVVAHGPRLRKRPHDVACDFPSVRASNGGVDPHDPASALQAMHWAMHGIEPRGEYGNCSSNSHSYECSSITSYVDPEGDEAVSVAVVMHCHSAAAAAAAVQLLQRLVV